jgi:hypothetical protein
VSAIIVLLASTGTAAQMYDTDVEVNISQTDIVLGDNLTMAVSLDGFDEERYTYEFVFGGEPVETTETVVEHPVTGMDTLAVRVLNGSETIAEGHPDRSYGIEPPEELVQIAVPDTVEPGETFNATAVLSADLQMDLEYQWREIDVVTGSPDLLDQTGPTIALTAQEDETPPNAHLDLEVTDSDGHVLDETQADIEWDLYNPDVDGIEGTYEEGYVELEITRSRIQDHPEARIGTSLTAWDRIQLDQQYRGGGIELILEQVDTDELSPPDDLLPYTAVDISGRNVESLELYPIANVEKEWLAENGLLVSETQAHISYYRIEDGEWERLPSERSHSTFEEEMEYAGGVPDEEEGYVGLRADEAKAQEQGAFQLGEETRIVIAGETTGLDLGRFAVGPDGQCEEFEEGAPVPPGWEEIDVSCDVHRDAQNTHELLDRWEDEEGYEIPERFEENISAVRGMIEDYDVYEARQKLDTLRQTMNQYREKQQRIERIETEFEQEVDIERRLPPDIRDEYNRSEKLEDLIDEFRTHMEERNVSAAERTLDQIEEQQDRDIEQWQHRNALVEEIDSLRQRDLDESQQEQVREAERLLEEGNLTAAEEQLRPVQEAFQRSEMRAMIESVVRSIISDILGLDLGAEPETDETERDPRQERSTENESLMDDAGEGSVPPGGR